MLENDNGIPSAKKEYVERQEKERGRLSRPSNGAKVTGAQSGRVRSVCGSAVHGQDGSADARCDRRSNRNQVQEETRGDARFRCCCDADQHQRRRFSGAVRETRSQCRGNQG